MPWWNDTDDEDELAKRWEQHRQKLESYVQVYKNNPTVGKNLANWADHAPMLPRSILLSFARANINPESKVGKWAISSAVVALSTKGQESRDLIRWLGQPVTAATIGGYGRRSLQTLQGTPLDKVADLTPEKLQRIAQGKDPNPGPGGVGGIVHDVLSADEAIVRGGFGVLQAGYEGVQAGFRASLGAAASAAHAPAVVATPQGRQATLGVATGGGLPVGAQAAGAPQIPDRVKFAGVEVSTDPDVLTDPRQITFYNMLRGEESGSGIFPAGKAAQTQVEAARAAASVTLPNGERSAVTPGRFLATQVLEPGTKPYDAVSGLTDLGVALYADPANLALGKISEVRGARKLFTPEAAGAYKGLSKYVHGPTFTQWADGPGSKVLDHLAKTDEIRVLRRQLGKDFPAELLAPLQDATDVADVRTIMNHAVEGGLVRHTPTWGFDWGKNVADIRWFSKMPGGEGLHVDNMAHNIEQVERLAVTAKVAAPDVERVMSRAARTTTMSDLADFAFHDLNDTLIGGALAEWGIKKPEKITRATSSLAEIKAYDAQRLAYVDAHNKAKDLFRFFPQDYDDMMKTALDDMADPLQINTSTNIGGTGFPIYGPHLENELLNQAIPLPDGREIRHSVNKMRPILESGLAEGLTDAGDWFMQDLWKPMALLRGAWTVRVVGEEQVRMAAAGLDSMFHHPMSWIAYATKHKGDLDVTTEKSFEGVPEEVTDIDPTYSQAMAGKGKGSMVGVGRDQDIRMLGDYTTYRRGTVDAPNAKHVNAWADEYSHLGTSPTIREVARDVRATGGLDNVKQSFFDGNLKPIREKLQRAKLWGGKSETLLATREGSDAYIDSVYERIRVITGDDPELIDGLATSSYVEGRKIKPELYKKLKLMAADELGPEVVRGRKVIAQKTGAATATGSRLDRAVRWMFNGLMTVPTNKLSRSPAFKQFYWAKLKEVLPYMDDAAQAQFMRVAKASGIERFERGPLGLFPKKIDMPAMTGTMAIETADEVAKAHALDSVRKLLYDTSERSHSWDALRLIFPFGEAFKEVTTRWAKLAWEEPRVIRRFQQGVYGARGSGFFYTNPDDGKEYFNFPFSQYLSQKVTAAMGMIPGMPEGVGAPFPMRGSVQGLNIVGQGLPGVGPVVQILASKMVPKDPKWDWIREAISPYGDPETNEGFFESFLPGWLQKARTAGWLEPVGIGPSADQERVFENAVKDSATYLASNSPGKYNLTTSEGIDELIDDARDLAKRNYLWRTMAQFVSPTAPQVTPQFKGKDGQLYDIYVIAKDYQRLKDENDGDWAEATKQFDDKYGDTAYMLLEPRGKREVYGAPTTKQAEAWRLDHKSFNDNYKDVAGYFAPQGGDLDYNAYRRSLARGDIEPTTAREYVEDANDRVASALFRRYRAQLSANMNQDERNWLAQQQDELKAQFYGYDPKNLGGDQASRDFQIRQLQEAITKKDVKGTPIAEAAAIYLKLRNTGLKAAADIKEVDPAAATLDGKSVSDVRRWLREKGAALVLEYPEFTALWDGVLSGEVEITRDELEEAK